MFDALLISEDHKLIIELQKISAVTHCSLEVNSRVNNSEVKAARTVLIDSALNIVVDHPNVVIITTSEPGIQIWQKAAATKAKYVAFLPDAREWLLQNLTPTKAKQSLVIGVLGASGGVGTSLLASCLAGQFAVSNQVVLVETNSCSGGLDVLWGIEEQSGSRWPELITSAGKILAADVIKSLPSVGQVSILSSDSQNAELPKNLTSQIQDLTNSTQVIVIDLPSCESSDFRKLLELCSEIIITVGSTIRSTNAVNQLLQKFPELTSAKIVIRTLPGTGLESLSIAKTLGLPLIGQIPTDHKITEYLEQGISPSQLPSSQYQKAISEIFENLEIAHVSAVA
jgi:secretion/DNA translocation related CpaE-like protein